MKSLPLLWLALAGACGGAPMVPGYERLRQAGGGAGAEAGEVLLSELACLACHGERPAAPTALDWKRGPDLSAAGDRLRPSWVRAWLADPAAVSPGATMPHLLAGRPYEFVEDLTQYVLSRQSGRRVVEQSPGSAKDGEEIFKSIGCIACHRDLPLKGLGEKYAHGELVRFLLQPLLARPAGRMPDLHTTPKEAAHLAAWLAPVEPEDAKPFVPDAASAERGRVAFASLGCAACHERAAERAPVPWRDLKGGCLAENPAAGVPRYGLSEEQRTALRTALAARGPELKAPALEPRAAIRRIMLERDCFACHQREGGGGPSPELAPLFTSTREDLGDLGRFPPPLDGAGRKFQPAALEAILHGKGGVRNYMRVRMGDFGDDLAQRLPVLLAAADLVAPERPMIGTVDPSKVGRNEAGREIVGTGGYACIACHELHGHPSLGIGAYDLAEMPKRLRPEWMRDFLLDPASYPTGTRMPAFWPDGKPLNPKLPGGKDADRQIDSVRVYLTEADQSIPPPGLADEAAYELKPADRPIVFRTFIAGVGTHAIAVGFPAGVNTAFDALEARWALAWRGRFLDAGGTWNQRFTKMEQPLGEGVIKLGDCGALEIAGLPKPTLKFRGYRIEADGVPVFSYGLGTLTIEDRLEPTDSHGLRRKLRVSGQTNEQVVFTAKPPAGVTVKPASGTALRFKGGVAELTEEISW
ncbi:MAG TPA: hypothetical protein VGO11_01655 [Chthoniobacteraceae bacterium]|jgi:cytochrome c551/c552|nr:hypothetical protein [Chthoniobacteraceae bacterium]